MLLRLVLGGVLVYAAWTKLRQPWLVFALSIDAYRLLPEWAVIGVARTLPWAELLLGGLLLGGFLLRIAAPVVVLLLGGFYAAMIRAWSAGASIDCGCFGIGEALGAGTLVRDGLLLGAAAALSVLVLRRGPRKVD
jgi:uncharacterized membrane protein YphA (DoxX/SURF4 family)